MAESLKSSAEIELQDQSSEALPLCEGAPTHPAPKSKSSSSSEKLAYRVEIDGLRCFAVVPVCLYHYGGVLGGGFAGVDVFFVISGYLITSIVVNELCAGKPVLREFWERRVRRLFPAILFMLSSLFLYGWFHLATSVYSALVTESIFALLASSNVFYFVETRDLGGYAAAGPEHYPLLHFWSLAVEEQFYLALPVALAAIWRLEDGARRWRWTLASLGGALAASFMASLLVSQSFGPFAFYLLPTRAWELLVGSLVGLGTSERGLRAMRRGTERVTGLTMAAGPLTTLLTRLALELAAWLGMASLILVYVLFTHEMEYHWPYYYALAPVIGTALVLIGTLPRRKKNGEKIMTTVAKFLSFKPFIYVGKMSYSLYLWHWPIWCFLRHNVGSDGLACFLIAAALSAFSTECVEQPFRSKKVLGRKMLWIIAGLGWMALLIFSLTAPTLGLGGSSATISARGGGGLWVPNGTEPTEFFIRDANPALFSLQGIKDSLQDLTTEEKNDLIPPGYSIKHCQGIYGATPEAKECLGAEKNIVYNTRKGPPCVAFVGDSHMMAHEWTIAELAKEYDVSYLWLPRSGNNAHFESPPTCWDAQRLRILKSNKPKTVVFGHYYPYSWRQYQSSGGCGPRHSRLSEKEYRETFDALLAGDPASVLVMGDNPRLNFEPWRIKEGIIVGVQEGRWANLSFLSTVPPRSTDEFERTEKLLSDLIANETKYSDRIRLRPIKQAFMDENSTFVQVLGAETKGGNRLLFKDADHLSREGSLRLKNYFRDNIFERLQC